jgi:hypothetical protein
MTRDRSADIVARMIASKITGREWELPPWLPLHYLTTLDDSQQALCSGSADQLMRRTRNAQCAALLR